MFVLRVIALHVLAALAGAETFSIGDQTYPYLSTMSSSTPIVWHTKGVALRTLGAQAIRINSRGIRFIPASYSAVVMGGTMAEHDNIHFQRVGEGWVRIGCTVVRDALCRINVVNGSTDVFPNFPQKVYISPTTNDEVLDDFLGTRCPETKTGRVLSGSGRHDISVCNVLGAGADYVFLPDKEMLFLLPEPISFQVITAISVLTVFMAVVLAHNLEYTISGAGEPSGAILSIVGMLGLLFLTAFATGNRDFLSPFVTLEDRLSFTVLFAYILYYTSRAGINYWLLGSMRMDSPVNPILSTLCVVPLRLYGTLDNPYTTVLTFLLATRLLNKLFNYSDTGVEKCQEKRGMLWPALDIAVDCIVVTILVYFGIVPQSNHDPAIVALYMLEGFFGALALNLVVLELESRHEQGPPS